METRNQKTILIGLCGKAGSGKDSAADYLVDHHGFTKYSLAAPMKVMLSLLLHWVGESAPWGDREWKEAPLRTLGVSPRYMAQTLGTEWGRHLLGENFWVDVAALYMIKNDRPYWVVPDIRFDNEAKWIKDSGGILIQINRPDAGLAGAAGAHASEQGVRNEYVDGVVVNDGTMALLHSRIVQAVWSRI